MNKYTRTEEIVCEDPAKVMRWIVERWREPGFFDDHEIIRRLNVAKDQIDLSIKEITERQPKGPHLVPKNK
jgi:hypothetical protein